MTDYSNLFVCLMGMGIVFIGLICIIILVSLMSSVVTGTDKAMAKKKTPANVPADNAAVQKIAADQNSQPAGQTVTPEIIAAVSAVIAEEMGTDISAIRIVSMKRI